ncbi:molybdenum cofactor guanylyltransferase [Geomonas sp. Red32]|uniref:molybdenum cofactor guanylyltransferase n=1 Tax=Geomonas sp. Red32 TaxID=2912856 RepID=UPI00202CE5DC|nr:molybdenum cofactor guanylyltransferase [Geomonas sp. Red32]MCM0082982.1 molybdenum cofactor guanylyltransferase [Geomonas sp. Red32]
MEAIAQQLPESLLIGTAGHPEREVHPGLLPGVTAVILAGGQSRRMGSNKAVLPYGGVPLIERIYRQVSELCAETVVVTNTPELYPFLPCPKVKDVYPGMGPLAGIHAALSQSRTRYILTVACDMPWISPALFRALAAEPGGWDVVIPEGDHGMEPLHALYSRDCLPAIESMLKQERRRVVSFFDQVRVKVFPMEQTVQHDPSLRAFRNINTVQEYLALQP